MKDRGVPRAWALTIAWIAIIALESFLGSGGNTSRILRPLLKWLLPAMTPAQFVFIHGAVRKTGHFVGYAVLSLLFYRSWWTTLRARSGTAALSWAAMLRAWMWRAAVLALLGTLVIAAADEFHQSFAPGRGASIHDVALDGLGGLGVQCWMLAFSSSMAVGESKRRNRGKPNLTSA